MVSEKAFDGQYLCYGNTCSITTSATNVCSDGMKIEATRKSGEYKDYYKKVVSQE